MCAFCLLVYMLSKNFFIMPYYLQQKLAFFINNAILNIYHKSFTRKCQFRTRIQKKLNCNVFLFFLVSRLHCFVCSAKPGESPREDEGQHQTLPSASPIRIFKDIFYYYSWICFFSFSDKKSSTALLNFEFK